MWLSSYQLYAHFQLHTNHLGFFYNRKSKQFEPLNSGHKKNYNFIRAAGWFCAMIKSFAKTVSEECTVQPRMPFGSLFRSWQRCILLPASPATIEGVHSKFTSRGTTAVKSVHAAMSQYTDFLYGDYFLNLVELPGPVSPVSDSPAGGKRKRELTQWSATQFAILLHILDMNGKCAKTYKS